MNNKALTTILTSWIIDLVILSLLIAGFFAINIKLKDNTNHNLKINALEYNYVRSVSFITSKDRELNYLFSYNPEIVLSFSQPCLIKAVPKGISSQNFAAFNCVYSSKVISEDFSDNKILIGSK